MAENAQSMVQRLRGIVDPRSTQGMLSRGRNVYAGGSPQAQVGGKLGMGRPTGTGPLQQLAARKMQTAMQPPQPAGVQRPNKPRFQQAASRKIGGNSG